MPHFSVRAARVALFCCAGLTRTLSAGEPPIVYTVRVPAPSTHRLEVEARVPADGQGTITLRWARWTPGFYRVEDYSAEVEEVFARDPQGKALALRRDP